MEAKMLTLSQRKTYEFIQQFFADHEYAPTAAEIAEGIGIKSRGVVHRYLKALEAAGYIHLEPKRHRNIRLLNIEASNDGDGGLPLVGAIAAGRPIEAITQHETVDVANVFLGPNRYALRVKGDSMVEEGIFDGDIVVCEQAVTANNGNIVVALIDGNEATLKRFHRNPDETVTLFPANQQLQPMTYGADRVQVQGRFVGLLRYLS
jgi:repressor LexA